MLREQIPWVQEKVITGSDNVDSWSVSTWDTVLVNIKIVITTPRVLLDALLHGFVNIASFALIVFDEGKTLLPKFKQNALLTFFELITATKNTTTVGS